MSFEIEDYSNERLADLQRAAVKALTKAGIVIENSAKSKARWGTGQLRDGIDHKVIPKGTETVVVIGSNDDHFPHNEFGTGEFAENGMGRKGGWWIPIGEGENEIPLSQVKKYGFTISKNKSGKQFAFTRGIEPQPMLRPAFRENKSKIKQVIEDTFKQEFDR